MDNITSLQISNGKVGTGAEATAGKTVSVHYTGWLYDPKAADHKGKKFDSSRDHGDTFDFKLGAGTDLAVGNLQARDVIHVEIRELSN